MTCSKRPNARGKPHRSAQHGGNQQAELVGVGLTKQLGCGAKWKVAEHTTYVPRLDEQRCAIDATADVHLCKTLGSHGYSLNWSGISAASALHSSTSAGNLPAANSSGSVWPKTIAARLNSPCLFMIRSSC